MNDRQQFIEDNLRLVHACCHKLQGRGIEYDDLYSAGCIGLVKAVDGFDPHKGFRLARKQFLFDDLERGSFLSAKTRLGEPSIRIALLEAELYARVRQCAVRKRETLCAPVNDKALARAVLQQSVSIREKLLQGYPSDLSVMEGRKLLDMVRIYPAEKGKYTAPDGKQIVFDRELGVLLMDGEK